MRKMKVIALVAAIIAGLALYKFLDIISQPQEIPTTPVVVAAVNIPENTEITADMLQIQPIPTQAVQNNAVLDMEQAIGLIMSSDVLAGEQIVFGRLVKMGEQDPKSNTLAYVVEPGMRAMTISVGFTSGMATMIKPGNRVDVVLNFAYKTQQEQPDGTTRAITDRTDGNFYQTGNEYQVFVYYRQPGSRYDRLVGYTAIQ